MIIGSIGVGLLLVAFALNLLKILSASSPIYLILNIIGSLMAAWYAYAGDIHPFVILEIVWAMTAFVRLVIVVRKPQNQLR